MLLVMSTFTLTLDNANAIPKNTVHLIVQVGIIEIPEALFDNHEPLETVAMAKFLKIIHHDAFIWCTSLKSIVFPDDSQPEEIGFSAYNLCISLQSIIILDSVTIIGLFSFSECLSLQKIVFQTVSLTLGKGLLEIASISE